VRGEGGPGGEEDRLREEGRLGGERQAVRIEGFDLGASPREVLEPRGETLIYLVSDDNYRRALQRTLLLCFELRG